MGRIIAIEAVARRSRKLVKPIFLPLSQTQRKFLLYRLADLTATTEAVLHHPPQGRIISQWSREQILTKVRGLVAVLRSDANVFVLGDMAKAIVVEGIEGNPYFVQMHDTDPRLCSAAIAQADALRLMLQVKLKCSIKPVPVGRPRLAPKSPRKVA